MSLKSWVSWTNEGAIIPEQRILPFILQIKLPQRSYSSQHLHRISDYNTENITMSNHAPITLAFNINETFFDYMALDESLLSDMEIVQQIKQKYYFQMNDYGEVSPSILWEGGK